MEENSFRDHISTIGEDGKRVWIYPKKPKGKFYNKRKLLSYFFLAFLFGAPHIRISGEPLLLFNIIERKFVLFGKVFWPQDFYLFAFSFILGLIFITLFTVVFGRLFCGWVCPQTIFMEMVFRRIEYFIEGDANAQKRLNAAPWDFSKFLKKGSKHLVFFLISFAIANTFLAYIIGSEELWAIQLDNPGAHVVGLSLIVVFSFVFYAVFAFMREQVCTTVCPYGRLQGVLLDNNTVNVSYDYERGEPRGKLKKDVEQKTGDCVDCGLCVQVCPTGIDIRNGVQLECVNCTACIDECDTVMHKIGKPKGLIRYASENSIRDRKPWHLNFRAKAYVGLLLILLVVYGILLSNRKTVETNILRAYGTTFQERGEDQLANFYRFKLLNKSNKPQKLHFQIMDKEGLIEVVSGDTIFLEPNSKIEGTFILTLKEEDVSGLKTPVEIGVFNQDGMIDDQEIYFSGPLKFK